MTITIGSSHHFLFCARNDQNSLSQALALGFGGGFLELAGRVGGRLAHGHHLEMVKSRICGRSKTA